MSASGKRSSAERLLRHSHLWGRRAATLVLLLLVLFIGAGVYLWTSQPDLLAQRAAAFLNARLFGPDTRVVVGKIRGMPFHRLILEDVRLEGEGPEGKMAFLSAKELEVSYDLWGILHGRYVASSAAARGLHLEFLRREGGLLLPTFRPGKKKTPSGRVTTFRIENIAVADGTARVELPWCTVTIDSLNGGLTVESGRDGLRLTAHRLQGRMNDALGTIELDRGTLSVRAPLRFQDLEGRWSGSPFALAGTIGNQTDLEIQLREFPLGRLGKFLNRTDLDRGYITRIQGNLKSEEGRVTFTAAGDLTWQEWVLEAVSGRGTIENGMLDLRDLNARLEGATLRRASVRLPLHEAWFTVDAEAEHLNTASLRIPVLDKAPGIVNGSAKLRFGDRKDFLRSLDMSVHLTGGEILEVPFANGNVVAVVRDGTFRFDSLFVALDGARAAARGKAGASFLDLEIDYAGNLVPLRRLTRQPTLGGNAELNVHLNGPPQRPVLMGAGTVRQFEVSTVRAPVVVLEDVRGPVNVDQDVHVRAVAPEGLTISNLAFARGFVTLAAARDSARVDSVAVVNADTLVFGRGSFRWQPEIRISVNEAQALAGTHHFRARSPFTIWRRGDLVSTPGLVIDTPRGWAAVEGSWNVEAKGGNLRADLRDIDPSIFFAASPPLAIGKMNGRIEITGSGDRLSGRADVGLREIDWKTGRAHFDSAHVVAVLEDQELTVQPLLVRRGTGEVEINGSVALPEPLVPLVKKLRQRLYPNAETTRWNLEVAGRGIDLAEWRFLVPPGQMVSGRVDLAGRLAGTSARPEIDVGGTALDLNWKGFEADSIAARASYAVGDVRIEELVLGEGVQSATVRGTFPLDVVLLPFSAKVPERPMDLHAEALDGSLKGLEFTPWIKKASGSLQAEIRAGGTPRHPQLDGWARVQNGRVELRERDEVVEKITARFTMKRDVVEVEEARGILTVGWAGDRLTGGQVSVEPGGTYRLATRQEQSYHLRIRLNQALVGERGIYAARVSGNLDLTPQRAYDGRIYPTARGDITVHRLEYGGSLKPQDVADLKPPSLLYEVNIDAPSQILIRSDRADGELGGHLTARRTPDSQIILGTLDVIEGSYQFLQKTFRVTEGTLTWDSETTRIPRVNIEAETKDAGYLITVNLSGYANQVELRFFAESLEGGSDQRALSDSEIMSLLALGSVGLSSQPTQNNQTTGAAAGFGLVGIDALFGGQVEAQLAQQLGIDADLEFENAWSPTKTGGEYIPTAGVSTYFGDLRLQYRQGLSRTYEQNIGLEYRLRRAIIVRGSIINLPGESNQEYNLEFKLRHDY